MPSLDPGTTRSDFRRLICSASMFLTSQTTRHSTQNYLLRIFLNLFPMVRVFQASKLNIEEVKSNEQVHFYYSVGICIQLKRTVENHHEIIRIITIILFNLTMSLKEYVIAWQKETYLF